MKIIVTLYSYWLMHKGIRYADINRVTATLQTLFMYTELPHSFQLHSVTTHIHNLLYISAFDTLNPWHHHPATQHSPAQQQSITSSNSLGHSQSLYIPPENVFLSLSHFPSSSGKHENKIKVSRHKLRDNPPTTPKTNPFSTFSFFSVWKQDGVRAREHGLGNPGSRAGSLHGAVTSHRHS